MEYEYTIEVTTKTIVKVRASNTQNARLMADRFVLFCDETPDLINEEILSVKLIK